MERHEVLALLGELKSVQRCLGFYRVAFERAWYP